MPLDIVECEQGTPEWHAARCGRVTGSKVGDVLKKISGGKPSAMRATYAGVLIAERLTNTQSSGGYISTEMQWGKDHEGAARAMYEWMYDARGSTVGFVIHPKIYMSGASPDCLINTVETMNGNMRVIESCEGGLEIKCPNTSTHLDSLLDDKIKPEYIDQIHWNMACTGAQWWDFVSYDPRLPPELQFYVNRFKRDDILIKQMELEVAKFLGEVDTTLARLRQKFELDDAA